jgi:hypothetical protein
MKPMSAAEIKRMESEESVRLKIFVAKYCLGALSIIGVVAIAMIVLDALGVLQVQPRVQYALIAAGVTPFATGFILIVRSLLSNKTKGERESQPKNLQFVRERDGRHFLDG